MMPKCDPWDRFFDPTLTLMIDFCNRYAVLVRIPLLAHNISLKNFTLYGYGSNYRPQCCLPSIKSFSSLVAL